jgi:hypothetical protein
MHSVHHVLVLVLAPAPHRKHVQRVAVVVLLQTIKECFPFHSRVVRVVAMASLLKTRVLHAGEQELSVALAK